MNAIATLEQQLQQKEAEAQAIRDRLKEIRERNLGALTDRRNRLQEQLSQIEAELAVAKALEVAPAPPAPPPAKPRPQTQPPLPPGRPPDTSIPKPADNLQTKGLNAFQTRTLDVLRQKPSTTLEVVHQMGGRPGHHQYKRFYERVRKNLVRFVQMGLATRDVNEVWFAYDPSVIDKPSVKPDKQPLAELNPFQRKVYDTIQRVGPKTPAELTRLLGWSKYANSFETFYGGVVWTLRALATRGLLARQANLYVPVVEGRQAG